MKQKIIPWLLAPVSRAYVGVLFVLLCFVAGAGWAVVSHDENAACSIQARGLRATPFLIGYLSDLHGLTTLPADKAAKRRAAELPPKKFNEEFNFLFDLNWNLSHYLAIEKGQPKHRSCG